MNFDYCPTCGKKGTVQKQDDTNYECANCKWHFWNNAKAAVGIALLKDEEVLVSRSGVAPVKGKIGLPGGFVNYGEDAYQAAIRELAEEAGITVERGDIELIETYPYEYMPGVTTCDLILAAHTWTGRIEPRDDVAEFLWKPLDFIESPEFDWPYSGLAAQLKQYWEKRQ